MTTETKICKVCNAEKPLTEYYTRKSRGKMIILPSCKGCMKEADAKRNILRRDEFNRKNREKYQDQEYREAINKAQRERRAADPEATRAKQRAYAAKNSETIAAQARAGYARNIEQRREDKRIYGEKNREVLRERNRAYHEKHGDEYNARRREKWAFNRDMMNAKQKAYRENNPDKFVKSRKLYKERIGKVGLAELREKRKFKERAAGAVTRAKTSGKIVPPNKCELCPSTENIRAHHDSYLYNDRLEVRWLCQKCHSEFHAFYKIHVIIMDEKELFPDYDIDDKFREVIKNAIDNYSYGFFPEDSDPELLYIYNIIFEYMVNLNLRIIDCEYGLISTGVYGLNVVEDISIISNYL